MGNCPPPNGRAKYPLCRVPVDGCDGRHHCQLSALPNRVLATVGVLVLIVAARRALFDTEIQRTSRSYGMDSPIWDVSGAPGGAGYGAIEKPGSGRTPGPQNSS